MQPHGMGVGVPVLRRVVVKGHDQVVGGARHADVEEPDVLLLVEHLLSLLCCREARCLGPLVKRDLA